MIQYIIISILVVILIVFSYLLRNLLIKVEKYEDTVTDQVNYLQNISKVITQSKITLDKIDTNGHFQADDELGEFFKTLKLIQDELNRYMLPENYGKKES